MIELPEAITISQQINEALVGKRIMNVTAAQHPHKFAWYFGDPQNYHELLHDKTINSAVNFGGLVEISVDDACILMGDGTNIRYYHEGEKLPNKHQLHIEFDDFSSVVATVQMYGGIWAYHEGENDNYYYLTSKKNPNPISDEFSQEYFSSLISANSQGLSLKAFLATEQRISGLGNGILQDILFNARLHPRKKLSTLNDNEVEKLFISIKSIIAEMAFKGGRDTERDLFGCLGGYKTKLSKNTIDKPCEICGDIIIKEAYMGGSIYFCPTCQSL
jgi:formamidopyrimidine-DNA glycosylase